MIYAESTVAMTVYNILAQAGRPMNGDALHLRATQLAHPKLNKEFLNRTLKSMVERKLVSVVDSKYVCPDCKRRRVISRDRSDAVLMSDGQVSGGWNKWMLNDMTLIKEVIA